MNDIKRDENINVGELFMQNNKDGYTNDGGIIIEDKPQQKLPTELENKLSSKFKELNIAIKSHEDSDTAEAVKQIVNLQEQNRQELELNAHPAVSAVKSAFAGKEITTDGKAINREREESRIHDVQPIVEQPRQDQAQQRVEQIQEIQTVPEVVQINVPQGESQNVIAQLSRDEREKVQTAKTIVVTEVKEVKIPTTKRKITNLNQYKELATSGLTEMTVPVPLPNSRYLVYVKGCGSLALATLMGDSSNHLDYIKRVEFCFKQITHTSIGQLSFDEFTKHTSPDDLDVIIHGILKASNPDQDEIQLTCGNPKCTKQFNFKYEVSKLVDVEESHDDLLPVVGEITTAARTITDAKEYHSTAAVRNTKVIELPSGHIVELITPTIYTLIEKLPLRKQLEQEFNVFTAMMSMLINTLYIKDTEGEFAEVDDVEVLASIIYGLKDEDLAVIKEVAIGMNDLGPTAFGIKEVQCPHCSFSQDTVPVNMDDMVFMKLRMSQII